MCSDVDYLLDLLSEKKQVENEMYLDVYTHISIYIDASGRKH